MARGLCCGGRLRFAGGFFSLQPSRFFGAFEQPVVGLFLAWLSGVMLNSRPMQRKMQGLVVFSECAFHPIAQEQRSHSAAPTTHHAAGLAATSKV